MRSSDDPASLSPDERLARFAAIFAVGVLRARRQASAAKRLSTLKQERRTGPLR